MKRQRKAVRRKAPKSKPVRAKPAPKKLAAKKLAAKAVRKKSRKAPSAKATNPVDALVAASAQALKLPLDPAWHGGVRFNLDLILRLGAVVDAFPLPDDAELAPVFHA